MSTIIKLLDIMVIVRKHILTPRARTQLEMDGFLIGRRCNLANMYSYATKVLFISLFYSVPIFPGLLDLAIKFFAGKFCLIWTWKAAPDVGCCLARLSCNCFFSGVLVMHVDMIAYWWRHYP